MGDSCPEVRSSCSLLDGAAEQADKLCGRGAAEAETAVLEPKASRCFRQVVIARNYPRKLPAPYDQPACRSSIVYLFSCAAQMF